MEKKKFDMQKLFWFIKKGGDGLDFSKDRHLIIHQMLALGSMADVEKLFREYGRDVIRQEFEKPVRGLYSPSVLHFFEHILGTQLENREQYIKKIYAKPSLRNS